MDGASGSLSRIFACWKSFFRCLSSLSHAGHHVDCWPFYASGVDPFSGDLLFLEGCPQPFHLPGHTWFACNHLGAYCFGGSATSRPTCHRRSEGDGAPGGYQLVAYHLLVSAVYWIVLDTLSSQLTVEAPIK